MKTLVKPQVKTTIAISSNQKYKKNLQVSKLAFKSINSLFHLRHIFLLISFLIFICVPESPELHSDLCNKFNSQQACEVW